MMMMQICSRPEDKGSVDAVWTESIVPSKPGCAKRNDAILGVAESFCLILGTVHARDFDRRLFRRVAQAQAHQGASKLRQPKRSSKRACEQIEDDPRHQMLSNSKSMRDSSRICDDRTRV